MLEFKRVLLNLTQYWYVIKKQDRIIMGLNIVGDHTLIWSCCKSTELSGLSDQIREGILC